MCGCFWCGFQLHVVSLYWTLQQNRPQHNILTDWIMTALMHNWTICSNQIFLKGKRSLRWLSECLIRVCESLKWLLCMHRFICLCFDALKLHISLFYTYSVMVWGFLFFYCFIIDLIYYFKHYHLSYFSFTMVLFNCKSLKADVNGTKSAQWTLEYWRPSGFTLLFANC